MTGQKPGGKRSPSRFRLRRPAPMGTKKGCMRSVLVLRSDRVGAVRLVRDRRTTRLPREQR